MSTSTARKTYFETTNLAWRREEAHRALTDRTTTIEPAIEVYPTIGIYGTPTARLIRGYDRKGEAVSLVFHPDEWAVITDAVLAQYGLRDASR